MFSFHIWLTLSLANMSKLNTWVLVEFLWQAPCKLTPVLQLDLSVCDPFFSTMIDRFLYKALVKDYVRKFEKWSRLYWADLLYKHNNFKFFTNYFPLPEVGWLIPGISNLSICTRVLFFIIVSTNWSDVVLRLTYLQVFPGIHFKDGWSLSSP